MKFKSLSLVLMIIALLVNINTTDAKSRNPKSKVKNSSAKPKIENQSFCVVRGYFEEVHQGESIFYICRMVSTAKCMAVPCEVWGPYGPNNSKAVEPCPVPENLQIESGKKYIVKFNEDGPTEVKYVNEINIEETPDFIAVHFN